MNVDAFLAALRRDPGYAGQIVHVHDEPARPATWAAAGEPISPFLRRLLGRAGIERLYGHQAEALQSALAGDNVVLATGTASGKSLGYVLPILESLGEDVTARSLLLFPTKALCQDQFAHFSRLLKLAGLEQVLAGVCDGDTPSVLRRRLRDQASVVFSNPDMLHAGIMPEHGRWAGFLGRLRYLVLDEIHVYNGIFGSNMHHVLRRFFRLCRHYGSCPQVIACSATIANPRELAESLVGAPFRLIDRDGSPRGRRVTVFWNPPRLRQTAWRGRRSANIEAQELMTRLILAGVPTITFSKARITAEMIHRYVCAALRGTAPELLGRVTPYRAGYLPGERRRIEARLFRGELLGVSTTPALELGLDVGTLEASILVGYPGTLAGFLQQAGRAGRRDSDALVILIGLDTSVNQYIMSWPGYVFSRPLEQVVIDPLNPFVALEHLRCAAHELPLDATELGAFGPHASLCAAVLESNRKVIALDGTWYHSAVEIPQHDVALRDCAEANVLIEDADSGAVLGEVDRLDAEPLVHPQAIYLHLGEAYRVVRLDLERNVATVQRVEVDYYTQPIGGANVHHIDRPLRRKPFGSATLVWGEVTVYCRTYAYEKIHFYSLDALSQHALDLPTMVLETQAVWLQPPDTLMEKVRRAGLDAHSGLRGIGYATRMVLPLFMTCDTRDLSHTVGSVNSPWQAVFVYERYPHGLGFTEKAYELMHQVLPAVYRSVAACPCERGCPCCVGKPLRAETTWNVERGEASIPSKAAALMILEGVLGDGSGLQQPDSGALSDAPDAVRQRLEQALRRRLERPREPRVFHDITPLPELGTAYPEREPDSALDVPDVARRNERRQHANRQLHKRIAKKLGPNGLPPLTRAGGAPRISGIPDASVRPPGMKTRRGNLPPTAFPGTPQVAGTPPAPPGRPHSPQRPSQGPSPTPRRAGDDLAARARKQARRKKSPPPRGQADPVE